MASKKIASKETAESSTREVVQNTLVDLLVYADIYLLRREQHWHNKKSNMLLQGTLMNI